MESAANLTTFQWAKASADGVERNRFSLWSRELIARWGSSNCRNSGKVCTDGDRPQQQVRAGLAPTPRHSEAATGSAWCYTWITYSIQPRTQADSFGPTNPTVQPFRCANSELVMLTRTGAWEFGIGDLRSLKIQEACIPNHDDVEEERLDPALAISSSIGSFLINAHRRTSRCNIRITFLLRTA